MATPSQLFNPVAQTTLLVTIYISPTDLPAFLTAMRPCWQACSREPECIFFDVHHSASEPGTIQLVEVWTKDEKWFQEHQLTKSYYEPYLKITEPMWVKPRKMEYFERLGGWCYVDGKYLEGVQVT